MKVRERVLNIPPYEPGEAREGYVKLSSNENNYGPSPLVLDAIKRGLREIHRYPPLEDEELLEGIANYCGVERRCVVLGNGSDELIDLLVKAFEGPVLTTYPTFPCYSKVAAILGEELRIVRLNSDFQFPAEALLEEASGANLVFLASPNNPTGTTIPQKLLEELLETTGALVVVDEAYFEFCGKSFAPKVAEGCENLALLRTFSKAFGLAGLRVGYLIAPQHVTEVLRKVRMPFSVNRLAQIAAKAALEDLNYMRKCVRLIVRDRERLSSALAERFRTFPSEANFVLVDTSPLRAEVFRSKLFQRRVIVRSYGRFEGFGGEYVRISIGTEEETELLLKALEELGAY